MTGGTHGPAIAQPGPGWLPRIAANLAGAAALLCRRPREPDVWRWWSPGRVAATVVIAVGAFAATMLLLDSWEIPLHRLMPYGVLAVFSEITDFGKSHWFLVPAGIALIAISLLASPRLGRTAYLVLTSLAVRLGFVFLAIGLPSLFVTIVKRLIGRARPPLYYKTGPFDFAPFSWRVEYASLPSGHATTAFAAAIAIGSLFPRARAVMWAYAALIALSRLVLAAHYPSDVLAGAAVGIAGALGVRAWFASRRLGLAVAPDGAIQALPGPSLRRIKRVARRPPGP